MSDDAINPSRVRTLHLAEMKRAGQRFTMLTSYDMLTARIFDRAGIDVLLVGDSAGNNVLGFANTTPVSLDAMALLTHAVASQVRRALVVGDLPFGSYEASDELAVNSAVTLMRAGAHAVKLEGGTRSTSRIAAIARAGIPVMGHIGFTPQSEHALGGFRIQGRGESAVEQMNAEALTVQQAGAFALVLELVPRPVAAAVTQILDIPTIGIGAGPDTDGQVLVWTDFAGLTESAPRFVKRYANLAETLGEAARAYRADVLAGRFPAEPHTYDE